MRVRSDARTDGPRNNSGAGDGGDVDDVDAGHKRPEPQYEVSLQRQTATNASRWRPTRRLPKATGYGDVLASRLGKFAESRQQRRVW